MMRAGRDYAVGIIRNYVRKVAGRFAPGGAPENPEAAPAAPAAGAGSSKDGTKKKRKVAAPVVVRK